MNRRINLERWQPLVEEARRRGVTLKAYAAEQGVSLYSLYRASQALREGAESPSAPHPQAAPKFTRVQLAAPASTPLRVSAQLPNGVSLHVEAGGKDLAAVIAALGALACSA